MSNVIIKNMPFKAGQTLTIVAVPNSDATNFTVNIRPDEKDIALHVNPRFKYGQDEKIVIFNSFQGGQWGEEHREDSFPFRQGVEFKMTIKFTSTEFLVTLPDGSKNHFPNRFGAEQYSVITVEADVRLRSFEIN